MKVNILNKKTGRLCVANITKVRLKDFDKITFGRFGTFEWQKFSKDYTGIYKLMKGGIILGLMHLGCINDLEKIKVLELIESSIENRGIDKYYDYIAGCLIAYACLNSMESGMDLGIHYTKETEYIYINYGLILFNEYYVKSDRDNSKNLISKYLKIIC